ncbi:unnamed protein product [Scytosiphon promiscuus]
MTPSPVFRNGKQQQKRLVFRHEIQRRKRSIGKRNPKTARGDCSRPGDVHVHPGPGFVPLVFRYPVASLKHFRGDLSPPPLAPTSLHSSSHHHQHLVRYFLFFC